MVLRDLRGGQQKTYCAPRPIRSVQHLRLGNRYAACDATSRERHAGHYLLAVRLRKDTIRHGIGKGGVNRLRDECAYGHRYTPENTFLYKGKCRQCRACYRRRARLGKDKLKADVIAAYGGKCAWSNCEVCDPDVLMLDHVKDDGARARRETPSLVGDKIYRFIKNAGYPSDYQVLCANHNLKKEILRRKANRIDV